MTRSARRSFACVLAALTLVATTGCAGGGRGAEHCSPRFPKTSDYVVRAGQPVTVSASAVTCAVRFTHNRTLTITGVDHTNKRFPLGTVRAYPSGAFERQIRVPAAAEPGPLDVFIDGTENYCPPNASCAAYATGVLVVDSSPDFSADQRANGVADGIVERMTAAIDPRPSLVEFAIVSDGVQATIHTSDYDREEAAYRSAFVAAQSTAPIRDRSIADAATLHITPIWHGKQQLDRLAERISNDSAWQGRHDLELSTWGPDPANGTVRISLRRYTDAAAVLLTARYGDAVSVSTRSVTASAFWSTP